MIETFMTESKSAGVLTIAKPTGMTSRDAVNVVQRLLRPVKVGHAGTLDPLATGVLVICIGGATRLVPWIQDGRKRYLATFRLGLTSDTDDITGKITATNDASAITRSAVEETLAGFVGRIEQVPPQFSAVHVQGQRAYDLARRGETVELAAKTIEVDSITLTAWNPPDFTVEILCGSGTYVRSIGRDLGSSLGCGALMTALERTAVGKFQLGDSVELSSLNRETVAAQTRPAIDAVSHLPRVEFSSADILSLRQGKRLPLTPGTNVIANQDYAAVDESGELIGIITGTDESPPRWMSQMILPFATSTR